MIIKTGNDFSSTMECIISSGSVISLPVNFSLSIFQIFNILGKRIRTLVSEAKEEGLNFEDWNSYDDYGYHTSNGVYYYQIRTNYGTDAGKMVLLRNN